MSFLEDLLAEDNKNKPTLDPGSLNGPDVSAPVLPPIPTSAQPQPRKSVVADYIASLAQKPDDDGTGLQRAKIADAIDKASSGMARGFGAAADADVRGAAGFANAIAGHGYTPGPVGSGVSIPQEAEPTAVKTYLAQKMAEQGVTDKKMEALKAAAEADKANAMTDALTDPNSVAARKVAVAEKESGRKQEQGDKGLGLKGRALDQGDEKIDLAGEAAQERARHDKEGESIAWSRLSEQQKKDVIKAKHEGVAEDRLKLMIAKFNKANASGITPGVEYEHPENVNSKDARANAVVLTGVDKLRQTVEDIKSHKDEVGGYASLPFSTKRMLVNSLVADLRPYLTSATGMGNFTVGHDHVTREMLQNPGYIVGLLNSGGFDQLLDQLVSHAQAAATAQVAHTPGSRGKLQDAGAPTQSAPAYDRSSGQVVPAPEIPPEVRALPPAPPGKMNIYNPRTKQKGQGPIGPVPDGWVKV